MSRRIDLPKIDSRTASDLLNELHQLIRHYTPEWPAKDEDDPGRALLSIFSFIAEGVVHRLNRAPERNLLAFLDMLGIRQLPKRPAAVPLRFIVALGTTDVFRILKGAQATASPGEGQSEPVSFESQEELLAIPSKLASLIAVDPQQDAIFKPPPGFRELSLAASPLPPLLTLAYSAVGSRYLQVNLPGQVKPGDFLRINLRNDGDRPLTECVPFITGIERANDEYVVVEDVKGSIITLTKPLLREYPDQTLVHKLTQFELFAGQNFQEHLLYLAHSKLFNVKGESRVELTVRHAPGSSVNRQPLNIAWEFYTENDETKEGTWQSFGVESDQTHGLSRDGSLILFKPSGEINERQVGGVKNRWIRGRLVDGITESTRSSLPTVESISLNVSSTQQGITPDRIFHNDTPLTLEPRFNPFGSEPRLFDRFYVASNEAFSKPTAKIKMNVDLDVNDLLGVPVAIFQGNNKDVKLRVFARGTAGRLVEFQIDPLNNFVSEQIVNHKAPPDKQIVLGSTPAVIHSDDKITVIVKVVGLQSNHNQEIYLRDIPSSDQASHQWYKVESPRGEIMFNPAAIKLEDIGGFFLFAVVDHKVQVIYLGPNYVRNSWIVLPGKSSPKVASTPFILNADVKNNHLSIVVNDIDGRTWLYNSKLQNENEPERETWKDITPFKGLNGEFLCWQPKTNIEKSLYTIRPHALSYEKNGKQEAIIILRNINDELVVFYTEENRNPKNLGKPQNVTLNSNPSTTGSHNNVNVFIRGSDNQLWGINLNDGKWQPYLCPSGLELSGDPFVLQYVNKSDHISIFSTSDKNSLLEFRANAASGVVQDGPHNILVLDREINDHSTKQYYVELNHKNNVTVRQIDSAKSYKHIAVITKALTYIPTTATKYRLFRQINKAQIKAIKITAKQVVLSSSLDVKKGNYLFALDQICIIDSIETWNDNTKIINLEMQWDVIPSLIDDITILEIYTDQYKLNDRSDRYLTLAPYDSYSERSYKEQLLQIKDQDDSLPLTRKIVDDLGKARIVKLDKPYTITPKNGSVYRLSGKESPDLWLAYRDPDQTELRPELSWEYWNGNGWVELKGIIDKTQKLLVSGEVSFTMPRDLVKTEVVGQENYWIRARIVGGDYGRELYSVSKSHGVNDRLIINKNPIRPPLINKLSISYEYEQLQDPQYCLTYNNLTYLDQTAANLAVDKTYQPFLAMEDERKSLYIGFDRGFEGGPVRVYFAAEELPVEERNKPKLNWTFTTSNGWQPLSSEDKTDGLTKPEFVTWVVPPGFQQRGLYGDELYWVRGELAEGTDWRDDNYPLLSGVFPNTVRTIQARTILNEILGSSRGIANQKFRFAQRPVLEGEEVRVREALTQQLRDELLEAEGEDSILDIVDQQGRVQETWVRWKEVREFFDSRPDSRHYRLDRASGEIEFGDNKRGLIPPAGGDNIRAFVYQTGGGAQGNVPAGAISSAVTAIAGLESVINPVPAGGGSEEATVEAIKDIGAAQISHRGRAVTPEDYERLAQEASREVRKVLCLPNRNNLGLIETGWVTVLIAPDSTAAEPEPSLELRNAVKRYLAERGDATVVAQNHIFVGAPSYAAVSVHVTVRARSFDVAGMAEAKVQQQLAKFLHPLSGGLDGNGWDFGRGLTASDLYTLIEDIDEVDHVVELNMYLRKGSSERLVEGEQVIVDENALLTGGTHRVSILVDNGA